MRKRKQCKRSGITGGNGATTGSGCSGFQTFTPTKKNVRLLEREFSDYRYFGTLSRSRRSNMNANGHDDGDSGNRCRFFHRNFWKDFFDYTWSYLDPFSKWLLWKRRKNIKSGQWKTGDDQRESIENFREEWKHRIGSVLEKVASTIHNYITVRWECV